MSPFERRGESVRGFPFLPRKDAGVDAQGRSGIGVPQPARNDVRGEPLAKEHCRVTMPWVVEAHAIVAGAFRKPPETGRHARRSQRFAAARREDEIEVPPRGA